MCLLIALVMASIQHGQRVKAHPHKTPNVYSIHIDRVRTRKVKVPNLIKCSLSQSTSVCGLNPVRSGLEWNVGGRSPHHMTPCTCTFIHHK